MWRYGGSAWWRASYRRAVRSTFATVPLYRERWALSGRTDPVLVPGRPGRDAGAISATDLAHRMPDLVPIGGGAPEPDPLRGLGFLLPQLDPGALVAVLDPTGPRPPADLPRGVRGCVLDPDRPGSSALAAITNLLRRNGTVLAVGPDKHLDRLAELLPPEDAAALIRLPVHDLETLATTPPGLLHDPFLGFLGSLADCGRWHVDWRRVYVRETPAGLAFTVLSQRSPRLVDILISGGIPGQVTRCPHHATPVLLT